MTEVCLLTGLFKQKLSVYGNRVPPRSLKVVGLWIFPALQFHTSLLIARDTCNPHALGTLFVGSQQFSWTWSWSKQSYRRVFHNEVTSSHRPAALPAAAQTTGTENKWHNSCTSLQNYSDLAVSPPICVQWHKWRAGKNARHGWIKLQKHRNFRMQVYDPQHRLPFCSWERSQNYTQVKSSKICYKPCVSYPVQPISGKVCTPLASNGSACNHQNCS